MLRRGKADIVHTYGFLLSVEIAEDDSTTPEQVAQRLADSISFMEGTGLVDVESLGKIDTYDAEDSVTDDMEYIKAVARMEGKE